MSTSRQTSISSVKSEGEVLLDEDGWKSEAESIIRDVGEFVQVIHVSDVLESSASRIYLNVTTLESKEFTVALTGEGFRIVSEGKHNSADEDNHLRAPNSEGGVFETPYSLLGSISPGFRDAFGRRLSFKLEEVFKSQQKEEEAQQS